MDKIRRFNEQNTERGNKYLKTKPKTDIKIRLFSNTRNTVYKSLKGLTKPSSRDLLGIDIDTYRKWVKCQFTPKMNWSNIKIDHITPICLFDVSKDEEIKEASCWKNTQSLIGILVYSSAKGFQI